MEMDYKTRRLIGTRINGELGKKGISQKELADALNIPSTTVSSFCSGKRTPNTQQIIEISNFLDISADYLLGISDFSPKDDFDGTKICKKLNISEETYNAIKDLRSIDNPENGLFGGFGVLYDEKNFIELWLISLRNHYYDLLNPICSYASNYKRYNELKDYIDKNRDKANQHTIPQRLVKSFLEEEQRKKSFRLAKYDFQEAMNDIFNYLVNNIKVGEDDTEQLLIEDATLTMLSEELEDDNAEETDTEA